MTANKSLQWTANNAAAESFLKTLKTEEVYLWEYRTKEGLAATRAKGAQLGRPKGPVKSRLDPHQPEIDALLQNGSRKSFIARRYKVSQAALYNWLVKKGLDKIDAKP